MEVVSNLGDQMETSEQIDGSTWLLPLVQDLAEDFWPRAAVGELDLDCEAIAKQAFKLLDVAAAGHWNLENGIWYFHVGSMIFGLYSFALLTSISVSEVCACLWLCPMVGQSTGIWRWAFGESNQTLHILQKQWGCMGQPAKRLRGWSGCWGVCLRFWPSFQDTFVSARRS